MKALFSAASVLALLALPALAHADAIPGCPPGQHVVMNPVPPGSMHHGGGHCEPNTPPPPPNHGSSHHHPNPHPTPPPPPPAPPSGSGSRS